MAFVQSTARFSAAGFASVGTSTLTTTAGNTAFLTVGHFRAAGTAAPSSIVDSNGNTPANDQSTGDSFANNTRASISSIPLTVAGAGHSWTINFASTTYVEGNVSEFGDVEASPFDVGAGQGYGANNVSSNTATTAVTAQADELVIVCAGMNHSDANCNVSHPPTGYTVIDVQQDSTVVVGYEAAYKYVSATGTQSVTWNFDPIPTGNIGAGVIATYQVNAAAPPATTPGRLGHFHPELRIQGWF
jgi:hypothetical protein